MDLSAIFKSIPAANGEAGYKIAKQLIDGGPAVVEQLVGSLGEQFGDSKSVMPSYALHAMVVYSSRPGADQERKMVAEGLAKQLEAKHSKDVYMFLLQQIQLCGRKEEIAAIAKHLTDDRLCEPAAQALQAIGGDAALAALREAQPKAEKGRRVTIDQAVELMSKKK
jgi:hypothetical protein